MRKEHDNGIKLAEKRHQEALDALHKNAKDVEKARSEAEVRKKVEMSLVLQQGTRSVTQAYLLCHRLNTAKSMTSNSLRRSNILMVKSRIFKKSIDVSWLRLLA